MAMEACDLAERFQTPVFVMMDLDLGMNNWMSDPFPYPEKPFDRGKVLWSASAFEWPHVRFDLFCGPQRLSPVERFHRRRECGGNRHVHPSLRVRYDET